MLESLSLSSFTKVVTGLWNSATRMVIQKPVPLFQKATQEPEYQAYLNFKEHVKYYPKRGFGEIISPHILLASKNIPCLQKAYLLRYLQNHQEKALGYFYNDLINHLVDLSASSLNGGAPDFQAFEAMLSFYESFVPEETYHEVLNHYKTLDRADFQQSILEVTRKINVTFRQMQLHPNKTPSSSSFKHLVLMATTSLLACRNLGLPLGLGSIALLAESARGAYPTVASPIPTQNAQLNQLFSYDFDLNQVFADADGDILSLADFKPSDGTSLPFWISAQPKKVFGKNYPNAGVDVVVSGDIAYVANSLYGCALTTFNVTNPFGVEFLGCLGGIGAEAIALRNPYLYAGSRSSGAISVIDVSNPRFPLLVRQVFTPGSGSIYDLTLSSQFLFAKASSLESTQIFSLLLPANPTYMSGIPGFNAIAGTNNYLYACNTTGFYVYDISNALSPQIVGNCNAPGSVMALQGNYVHVIDNNNLYQVVDIRNANQPFVAGNISTSGLYFNDLEITGNFSFAIHNYGSTFLFSFNLTDFNNIELISSFTLPSFVAGLTVQNNIVYHANGLNGLVLINVTNPRIPSSFVPPEVPQDWADFTRSNTTLFVADRATGILKFNISNITSPQIVAQFGAMGAKRVAVQNNFLYFATCWEGTGGGYFGVLNVSSDNFTALSSVGAICVNDFSIYNSTANLGIGDNVQIVDLTNKTNLSLVNTFSLNSFSTRASFVSNTIVEFPYLVIAGGYGSLQVYDVSNFSNPSFVNSLGLGFAMYLKVFNNFLLVSQNHEPINVIDLTTLPSLNVVSSIPTFGGFGAATVDQSQNLLYVASDGYNYYGAGTGLGFQMVNAANMTQVNPLMITRTPGSPQNLISDYPHVLVADGPSGLQIYDTSKVTISGLTPYYPTNDGTYNFTLTAINQKGETVSTSFQLHVNAPPKLLTNQLSLSQGETVTLTTQYLNAVDDATAALLLKYTVTQIAHGYFQTTQSPGSPIFGFSQQQVANGEIQFVHDGSTTPPSYQVYVNDGNLNSVPQWAAVTFNGNVLPILNTNQLTINTGQTVVLSSSNLQASDADIADINQLVFTVSNVQHGYFDLSSAPGVPIVSFTLLDLLAGQIRFTQDGSDSYPSYFVSVSDGVFSTPPSLVNIVFNNNAVPVILNNQITISPGQNFTLTAQNIGGLDFDSNNNNLVFTINNLSGGQFQLLNNPGMAVAQFTQQDILNGNVQFIADALDCDNSTSPSYTLQASDGSFNTLFNAAIVTYQREITTNGCVVTVSSEETDKIYIYIGIGVGVAALAIAATVMEIFAVKRKHMIEREKERIAEMNEMAEAAAQWKNQPLELSASAGSDEDLNSGTVS